MTDIVRRKREQSEAEYVQAQGSIDQLARLGAAALLGDNESKVDEVLWSLENIAQSANFARTLLLQSVELATNAASNDSTDWNTVYFGETFVDGSAARQQG